MTSLTSGRILHSVGRVSSWLLHPVAGRTVCLCRVAEDTRLPRRRLVAGLTGCRILHRVGDMRRWPLREVALGALRRPSGVFKRPGSQCLSVATRAVCPVIHGRMNRGSRIIVEMAVSAYGRGVSEIAALMAFAAFRGFVRSGELVIRASVPELHRAPRGLSVALRALDLAELVVVRVPVALKAALLGHLVVAGRVTATTIRALVRS